MVGLWPLLSSSRIIRSVHFKEFPSKEKHGLLELQLVQPVVVILHCKQFEQNVIIAAYLSSWNYSVRRMWVGSIIKMINGVNCTAYNGHWLLWTIAASAHLWNYSVVEGYGWTMTPVVNSSDDTTCWTIAACLNSRNPLVKRINRVGVLLWCQ